MGVEDKHLPSVCRDRFAGTGASAHLRRDGRSAAGFPSHRRPAAGFTLLELLVVLAMTGILAGLGLEGLRVFREAAALRGAADATRGHMARARILAVTRRETVRIRLAESGDLVLLTPADEVLGRLPLTGRGEPLDSARVAPVSLSYNARGQAAPGSVYLYRGDRGVRLVSNFLGRVREERFRL